MEKSTITNLCALQKYILNYTKIPSKNILGAIIADHKSYEELPIEQIIDKICDINLIPKNTLFFKLYHFKSNMRAHICRQRESNMCMSKRGCKNIKNEFAQIIKESLRDIDMDLFGSSVYNPEGANDIDLLVPNVKAYIYVVTILQIFFTVTRTNEDLYPSNISYGGYIDLWTNKLIDGPTSLFPQPTIRQVNVTILELEDSYVKIDFVDYPCASFFDFVECTMTERYDGLLWLRYDYDFGRINYDDCSGKTENVAKARKLFAEKKLTPCYYPIISHDNVAQTIRLWIRAERFAMDGFTFVAPIQCGSLLAPSSKHMFCCTNIIQTFVEPVVLVNIIVEYAIWDHICLRCMGENNVFVVNMDKFLLKELFNFPSFGGICVQCFQNVVMSPKIDCKYEVFRVFKENCGV